MTCLTVPAQAQDTGGLVVGLDYGLQLRSDDAETALRNSFGLSVTSQTRSQSFSLALGAALDITGDDTTFDDQRMALGYSLETRNTVLSLDAALTQTDIQTSQLQLVENGLELILDDGDRRDVSVALGYEFGREAPFGGALTLRHTRLDYVNTNDPALVETETNAARLSFRFEIDPQVTATLELDHSALDRETGNDVTSNAVRLGASFSLSQQTQGRAALGFSQVENTIGADQDGQTFSLGLIHALPNGELSGDVSSDLNENGRRTDISVARSLELRNGNLSGGLGVTFDDEGDSFGTFRLGYAQDLPRGNVSLALNRDAGVSSVGADVLNTRLDLRYAQALNSLANISLGFGYGTSDFTDPTREDVEQISVNLSYSQTLTDRWSLVGGYTHTRSSGSLGTETRDDIVFLGIEASTRWRP